ncbi:MAG: hypothetical protein Q9N34_04965 [Aquificota bacterium]|nr:hypothetical protein [Aquificota bacterium]
MELGAENLVVAGADFTYSGSVEGSDTFLEDYSFQDLHLDRARLGLWGKWQVDNAALALTASHLFTDLDPSKAKKALEDARWEGRMEVLREDPLLIVDGSHNPYAIAKVVKEALRVFDVRILFTGLRDKEWELSLQIIRRHTDTVYLTQVSYHRGESVANLYKVARQIGFRKVEVLRTPAEVWTIDENVLALGSLYLVGEEYESRGNTPLCEPLRIRDAELRGGLLHLIGHSTFLL